MSSQIPDHPINLSVETHFSYLSGTQTLAEITKRAKAIGAKSIGMMDRHLGGALEFATYCRKVDIKPIIGLRLKVKINGHNEHLSIGLIATDEPGWYNLSKIGSLSEMVSKGDALNLESIFPLSQGTILMTGIGPSSLGYGYLAGAKADQSQIDNVISEISVVWEGRLYIEIERPYRFSEQSHLEDRLLSLAGQKRLKIVGTSDIRYDIPEHHERWTAITANDANQMFSKQRLHDEINQSGKETLRHIRDADELKWLFRDVPEALLGAAHIEALANYAPSNRKSRLPKWPEATETRTEDDILREETLAGLEKHLKKADWISDPKPYYDRLEYELSIIIKMGFSGYFLMVSDFMKWCIEKDIPLGPGRGSGAGSIVAWTLNVTKLDPLRYDLLFERFLNPNRVSMPDFDVDVCSDRRQEVIQYIESRYGRDRVVQIANYNEMKGKGAIKMAGRTTTNSSGQHFRSNEIDEFNKLLDKKLSANDKLTLSEIISKSDQAREYLDKIKNRDKELFLRTDQQPQNIILDVLQVAEGLQGVYTALGTHASGIIISPDPLVDSGIPLVRTPDGNSVMCGYDMKSADNAGLVKFDILGLAAVTIIHSACQQIKSHTPKFDIDAIPLDDAETYLNFKRGLTSGVFQFESEGMRGCLRDINTSCMDDLIAAVSLFRPGPMAYLENYANRKNGTESFEYYHPYEKNYPTLKETYGIMVYQEQVMRVAQNSAGFSLAAADEMRRAIGKKIASEIERLKNVFIFGDEEKGIPGAIKLGMSEASARELYADIEKFSDYGFNKSHAAAYALVAYQTMYLKTHYPAEFLSAAMSNNMDDSVKIQLLRQEAIQLGIEMLPPDINESNRGFVAKPGTSIRFGFGIAKGVTDLPPEFYQVRGDRPFSSIEDFCSRLDDVAFTQHQLSMREDAIDSDGATDEDITEDSEGDEPEALDTNSGADASVIKPKKKALPKQKRLISKSIIEALVRIGAFDRFQPNRRMALAQIEGLIAYYPKIRKDIVKHRAKAQKAFERRRDKLISVAADLRSDEAKARSKKLASYKETLALLDSLGGDPDNYRFEYTPLEVDKPVFPALEEWQDAAEREYATTKFYISRHPLNAVRNRLLRAGIVEPEDVAAYLGNLEHGSMESTQSGARELQVFVCGIITDLVEKVSTKTNSRFILARLKGLDGLINIAAFPIENRADHFKAINDLFKASQKTQMPVVVHGNVNVLNKSIRVKTAYSAHEVCIAIESKDRLIANLKVNSLAEAQRMILKFKRNLAQCSQPVGGVLLSAVLDIGGLKKVTIDFQGHYDRTSLAFQELMDLTVSRSVLQIDPDQKHIHKIFEFHKSLQSREQNSSITLVNTPINEETAPSDTDHEDLQNQLLVTQSTGRARRIAGLDINTKNLQSRQYSLKTDLQKSQITSLTENGQVGNMPSLSKRRFGGNSISGVKHPSGQPVEHNSETLIKTTNSNGQTSSLTTPNGSGRKPLTLPGSVHNSAPKPDTNVGEIKSTTMPRLSARRLSFANARQPLNTQSMVVTNPEDENFEHDESFQGDLYAPG